MFCYDILTFDISAVDISDIIENIPGQSLRGDAIPNTMCSNVPAQASLLVR